MRLESSIVAASIFLAGCGGGDDSASRHSALATIDEKAKPTGPKLGKHTVVTVKDSTGNSTNTYVLFSSPFGYGWAKPVRVTATVESKKKVITTPLDWTAPIFNGTYRTSYGGGSTFDFTGFPQGVWRITATEPISGASGSISVAVHQAYSQVSEVPARTSGYAKWGDPINLRLQMRVGQDQEFPAGIPGELYFYIGQYSDALGFVSGGKLVCSFTNVIGVSSGEVSGATLYERQCNVPSLNSLEKFYGPTVVRASYVQTEITLQNGAASDPARGGVGTILTRGLDCLDPTQVVCDPKTGGPISPQT